MSAFVSSIVAVLAGIAAVTAIDVFGSITSRRWNYLYPHLTPLSLIVYTMIGFFVGRSSDLISAASVACLVGIYDATVGWKLALILNANFGEYKEHVLKLNAYSRILRMISIGIIFGFAGYFLSRLLF
jgi:hypothetical protein